MADTLRLPIETAQDGRLRTLTQDSAADITQSVQILLSTPLGDRGAIPDYGLVGMLGSTSIDTIDIASAIADWEKRVPAADVEIVAQRLVDGVPLTDITVII